MEMEEKYDLSSYNIQKIELIQRKTRLFLSMRQVRILNEKMQDLREEELSEDPSQELLARKAKNQRLFIQVIPFELWIEIYEFVPDIESMKSMSLVCNLFNEISKMNFLWWHCYKYHFNGEYKKLDAETLVVKEVGWKNLMKEKVLKLEVVKEILRTFTEIKERGNGHYQKGEVEEAKGMYQSAIDFSNQPENKFSNFEDLLTPKYKFEYLKLLAVLYSNLSQTHLKLENWPQVLMCCSKSLKRLREVKTLLNDESTYEKEVGGLDEKVHYRVKQAWNKLPIRLVNYSDQPVEELHQGTILEHQGPAFATGIFADSKVLMTHFVREANVKGVIINKYMTGANGRIMRIGGPCELSQVTTLHDIPNVAGSREVVPGVYEGGDVAGFEGREEYTIREYHGYASWFQGQLEGEIRNSEGWAIENQVTPEMILNPTPMVQFASPADILH